MNYDQWKCTDPKLEAVEARTEQRFTELSGKIDRLTDAVTGLVTQVGEVRSDNKFTRISIIITVVASVIAGLAALWGTQANMLSAFQAGLAGKQEMRNSCSGIGIPRRTAADTFR